ncbi:hydroxymethylglutaryl-CoA lyase [Microbulbifer sp. ALW1]|uniref:hydroxymethylglutaryl-CoA lyase n=1 Tax=Microbulbifer sp. (strain ALW1) TaxID=1516059 RepID=UPI001358AA71|nr:hydroxymethylglutaryl-CoA lyase [Microbulbifer sp. ALW1]
MRERVWINDVGPRDGLQNQAKILTVEQRLALVTGLIEAGLPSIEVGAFVSPKAVPAMAGTDQLLAALPKDCGVDYQVLIPNLKGYQLARDAGARTVVLVVCATETMNQRNVRQDVRASLEQSREICAAAKNDGVRVVACVAVAWACPFEGATDPGQVLDLAGQLFAMGAQDVIVADTIGAANPAQVSQLMTSFVQEFDASRLACHFHDTRAMGVANVYAALEAGIRKFDSSVGGLGGCPFAPGATGNVASEDVVMMLEQMGFDTGIDLFKLMQVGKTAGEMTGVASGGRAAKWRALNIKG